MACISAAALVETFPQTGRMPVNEISMATAYSVETAQQVYDKAIQVHGGYGYTSEFAVERYYRDLRHLTMAEGTTQIQTLILGREILGVSAFT